MSTVEVNIMLDDLGLFIKRKKNEQLSQRERAEQLRNQFADCMRNALSGNGCIMPGLCATYRGGPMTCAHLTVDYTGFKLRGGPFIPLPENRQRKIHERLLGIGTAVYREVKGLGFLPKGVFAGDAYLTAQQKVAAFTGGPRRSAGSRNTSRSKSRASARAKKRGGVLGVLFGL